MINICAAIAVFVCFAALLPGCSENAFGGGGAAASLKEQLAVAQELASAAGAPLSDADLAHLQRSKPYSTNNEALLDNQALYERILRGYFYLAAEGKTVVSPTEITAQSGRTLRENYPEANDIFLRFANTYWTFRLWLDDKVRDNPLGDSLQGQPVVSMLLSALEVQISGLFFPTPGPLSVEPEEREATQRQVFKTLGVPIDIKAFIIGNPILIHDRTQRDRNTAYYKSGIEAGKRGDYHEALNIFRTLSELGHADSQFALGVMLYDGKGIPSDYEQAARWYREAALHGHANAQFNLAYMYREGQGVQQDDHEALRWNTLAAEQGHARAQHNVAVMYEEGQSVPRDFVEAQRWYRLAAKQGLASAQNKLGLLYGKGLGVPQDSVQAHMWFIIAAQYDNTRSKFRDAFASTLTSEQIAKAQKLAREWMSKK